MSAVQNTKTPSKPLSAKAIEAMKHSSPIKADVGENSGLRVKCGSTGVKTFFYRYKSPVSGKLTQIKIGNYPAVSLAAARVELEKLKTLRRSGVCPKLEKQEKEQAIKAEQERVVKAAKSKSFSIESLVELYLSEYIEDRYITDKKAPSKKKKVAGARKLKGQAEVRRTLYGDAVRVLGDLPADQLTRKQVVDLIMGVVDRGANVQAGNVLRELSSAYEFAIGLGHFSDEFANPALLARASLNQARVKLTSSKGKRVLTDKELASVIQWLPQSGFTHKQKCILQLTLWTACRSGEICGARWQDIDLEKGVWSLAETKNGAARDVQLSDQATQLLRSLQVSENSVQTYVFESPNTGKPIQQKSLTEIKWQLKNADRLPNRRKYSEQQKWPDDMQDWSPHDLRRTVRTGLSKLGCPADVAEAVLGHSPKGIEGTYNLHRYEDECRQWLQKWADYMSSI